jgi:hypothetical protein
MQTRSWSRLLCTGLVGMQVQNGKFVRVDPVAPGTFDCDNNKPPLRFSIDAAKEYHGQRGPQVFAPAVDGSPARPPPPGWTALRPVSGDRPRRW